jgi:hypothetical protein
MRNRITILIIAFSVFSPALSAQKILDSVKIYNFPVNEGIIYKYDFNHSFVCILPKPVVTIATQNDSAFYFQNGEVLGVFRIDSFYSVLIANANDEYICYSNLCSTSLKKKEQVKRGSFIGKVAKSDYDSLNSLDILILKKTKELSYEMCFEFIRDKISSVSNRNCSDLIGNSL